MVALRGLRSVHDVLSFHGHFPLPAPAAAAAAAGEGGADDGGLAAVCAGVEGLALPLAGRASFRVSCEWHEHSTSI